jgi:hypothetical protein
LLLLLLLLLLLFKSQWQLLLLPSLMLHPTRPSSIHFPKGTAENDVAMANILKIFELFSQVSLTTQEGAFFSVSLAGIVSTRVNSTSRDLPAPR